MAESAESAAAAATSEQKKEEEEGYIKTMTHNYVSRKAVIQGAKQVELKGRTIVQDGVTVRGDLAIVRMGRYCEVDTDSVLEPPRQNSLNGHQAPQDEQQQQQQHQQRIPLVIGSHTHIGSHCHIRAAAIGSMVWIGDHVTLGERVMVKDNCVIEDGVILGDDTVIPPFTRVAAAKHPRGLQQPTIMELPPSMAAHVQQVSLDRFQEFNQQQRALQ